MTRAIVCAALAFLIPAASFAGEIHDASERGDLEALRRLIVEDPAGVDARTARGSTPLHLACVGGNLPTVEYLVSSGADLDATNDSHYTPLHYAAARDHAEVVALLLDRGARLDPKEREGETPLHRAASSGALEAAAALIERGADVGARNNYGRAPLLTAVREGGGVEMVKMLIAAGSEIDAVDESGDGALDLAAWRGFGTIVDLLLDQGARIPDSENRRLGLLFHSAKRRLERLMDALVNAGMDLSAISASHPGLINEAASGGSTAIIELLVEHGFDLGHADRHGWTPLHSAAEFGRNEAMEHLLSEGAALEAKTMMGETALHIARAEGNEETVALLESRGADTDPPRFPDLNGEYLGQEAPGDVPEPFAPGIVNAHYGIHTSVAFSPDGDAAYWSIMIPPRESGYGSGRMLGTTLKDGKWTYPAPPQFEGGDVPFFSPDGERLYFLSRRELPEGGGSGENIWFVERTEGGWSDPSPVDAIVNAAPKHWQFSIDRAGTFYMGSGDGRILVSRCEDGLYENPVDFRELYGSDSVAGGSPYIAPDGDYLIFSRDDDLHITYRRSDGSWTDGKSLGDSINSPAYDLCPIVSPDGEFLFYLTTRDGVWGPHWVAIRDRLEAWRREALAE